MWCGGPWRLFLGKWRLLASKACWGLAVRSCWCIGLIGCAVSFTSCDVWSRWWINRCSAMSSTLGNSHSAASKPCAHSQWMPPRSSIRGLPTSHRCRSRPANQTTHLCLRLRIPCRKRLNPWGFWSPGMDSGLQSWPHHELSGVSSRGMRRLRRGLGW